MYMHAAANAGHHSKPIKTNGTAGDVGTSNAMIAYKQQ